MKKLFFVGILLLSLYPGQQGVAQIYYDTLKLEGLLKKQSGTDQLRWKLSDKKEVYSILSRYTDNQQNSILIAKVDSIFRKNPFINDFLPAQGTLSEEDREVKLAGFPGFSLGDITGLNITSIAEGLTGFIISRTEQELNTAFFERFKKRLEESDEFKAMFPQTKKALDAIDNQIYNFNAYLNLLRESFHKDLSNLFVKFPYLLDKPLLEKVFEKKPELRKLIKSTVIIVRSISNNEHPASIINKIAEGKIQLGVANQNLQEGIKVFDLFSESLRSQRKNHYWVSSDSLKLLLEPITFQIYLGLIYQQIYAENPLGLKDALGTIGSDLEKNLDKIEKYKGHLEILLERAELVEFYLQELKNKSMAERSYQDYHKFFASTVRFFEVSGGIFDLPNITVSKDVKLASKRFLFFTESIGDIYLDINEQRYSSAIVNFAGIYDSLITASENDSLKKVFDGFEKNFLKYGAFMASVVEAEDGDDVEQIIQSFALPPGSYRIKRESRFSISLNSYLGGFAGWEKLEDDASNDYVWGITAPVGFAFSFGLIGKSAPTVFVSLVDLGGVASFRFEHDDTEELPQLTLQNIIAPGVNLYLGIPGTPLVFGGGVQSGPQARKITVDGIESETSGYRWNVMVGVDIPVINLFTNPK